MARLFAVVLDAAIAASFFLVSPWVWMGLLT